MWGEGGGDSGCGFLLFTLQRHPWILLTEGRAAQGPRLTLTPPPGHGARPGPVGRSSSVWAGSAETGESNQLPAWEDEASPSARGGSHNTFRPFSDFKQMKLEAKVLQVNLFKGNHYTVERIQRAGPGPGTQVLGPGPAANPESCCWSARASSLRPRDGTTLCELGVRELYVPFFSSHSCQARQEEACTDQKGTCGAGTRQAASHPHLCPRG